MTTRDIEAHLREIYGTSVSRDTISSVTASVLDDAREWQRPLAAVYPIVYLDALIVKIRENKTVQNTACTATDRDEAELELTALAGGFRGDGPVIGWLLGIVRHKLADSLRRGRVEDAARRRLALEPLVIDDADLARVDERAAAAQPGLDAALNALPEAMRAALLARVVEEHECGEIAAELGCSQQLVRQRVHRGLARLRAALEEGRRLIRLAASSVRYATR